MNIKFEYKGKKFKSIFRELTDLLDDDWCDGCYFSDKTENCHEVPDDCINNIGMIYVEVKSKTKRYKIKQDIEYVDPVILYSVDAVNSVVEQILSQPNQFQIL
jgi:hypothetical protein